MGSTRCAGTSGTGLARIHMGMNLPSEVVHCNSWLLYQISGTVSVIMRVGMLYVYVFKLKTP